MTVEFGRGGPNGEFSNEECEFFVALKDRNGRAVFGDLYLANLLSHRNKTTLPRLSAGPL